MMPKNRSQSLIACGHFAKLCLVGSTCGKDRSDITTLWTNHVRQLRRARQPRSSPDPTRSLPAATLKNQRKMVTGNGMGKTVTTSNTNAISELISLAFRTVWRSSTCAFRKVRVTGLWRVCPGISLKAPVRVPARVSQRSVTARGRTSKYQLNYNPIIKWMTTFFRRSFSARLLESR